MESRNGARTLSVVQNAVVLGRYSCLQWRANNPKRNLLGVWLVRARSKVPEEACDLGQRSPPLGLPHSAGLNAVWQVTGMISTTGTDLSRWPTKASLCLASLGSLTHRSASTLGNGTPQSIQYLLFVEVGLVVIDRRPHWGTAFPRVYLLLRQSRPRRHLHSIYMVFCMLALALLTTQLQLDPQPKTRHIDRRPHGGTALRRLHLLMCRSRPRAGFYMSSGIAR